LNIEAAPLISVCCGLCPGCYKCESIEVFVINTSLETKSIHKNFNRRNIVILLKCLALIHPASCAGYIIISIMITNIAF